MSKTASVASQQSDKSTRAPIWNHWERATDNRKLAQCKYCAKSMYPNTNNMRNHTAKHHPNKMADEMPTLGFETTTGQMLNPLAGFSLVDTPVPMLANFPTPIGLASQLNPNSFTQLGGNSGMQLNSFTHNFNSPTVTSQYSPVAQSVQQNYSLEQIEHLSSDIKAALATLISSRDLSPDIFDTKPMKTFLNSYKELVKISMTTNNVESLTKLPTARELDRNIIPTLTKKKRHDIIESQNTTDPVIVHVSHDPQSNMFQVYVVYSLHVKIFYRNLFCSPNILPTVVGEVINDIEMGGKFTVRLLSSSYLPLIQHLGTITDKSKTLLFWSCTRSIQDRFTDFLSNEQNTQTIFAVRDIFFEISERPDLRTAITGLLEKVDQNSTPLDIIIPSMNPDNSTWCKLLESFLNISDILKALSDPIAIRVEYVLPRVETLVKITDALIDLTEIIPRNTTYLVSNFKYDIKNTILEISNCTDDTDARLLISQLNSISRDYETYNKDVLSLCEFFSNAATREGLPGAISNYITNIGASYNLPRIKVAKQIRDYMGEDHDDPSDPMSFWDKKDSEFTELKRISATVMHMLGINAADVSYNSVDYYGNAFMHLSSTKVTPPNAIRISLKLT